jgi:hypothetical protein
MSDGDDEADEPESDAEDEPADGGAEDLSVEDIEERLDAVETDLEAAETEADLDDVEADLDDAAAALEAADLPEPDDEDEDEESPTEALEGRIEDLRGDLEEQRGPYAADVVEEIESARATVADTRWTAEGEPDAVAAVESFLGAVEGELDADLPADVADTGAAAEALDAVAAAVEDAGLDADDDEETIAALLETTAELTDGLDAAEEWDDLTVREQMAAEGFYDRLTSENRKDFPPELGVVRIAEHENDPGRILQALDRFTSDFMEENCITALRRLAPAEAYEPMIDRAGKRDRPAIEVLGKIGDDRALDTLHDYIEGESNPPLQKTTLRAIGEIGSESSTQHVADRLVAEDPEVRSRAARALGRIGDTRAIDPLADALADDDSDSVRAAAAWALNAIGTRRALEAAAEYADDRAYIVQHEAERAAETLDAEPAPA